MNIQDNSENPILDKEEGNGKSLFAALVFAFLSIILIFSIQVYFSRQSLNIVISTNKALALSAFCLIGFFVAIESAAFFKENAKKLLPFGRRMGVMGLLFAGLHIILVTFALKNEFTKEWLANQNTSMLFAKVSVIFLTLIFFGFLGKISKKLGKKLPIYFLILGYLALFAIFLHTFFLSKAGYYTVGRTLLGSVRQLELTFLGVFLGAITILYMALYFINKRVSLQTKIIVHTFLYLTVSAIIIGSYIGISDSQRHREDTFYANRHSIDYVKRNMKDGDIPSIYSIADEVTDTYQREVSVFFLDTNKRIVHHPERKEEDTPYQNFGDKEKTKDGYGWELAYKKNGSLFLDTIFDLEGKGYIVVSSDYVRVSQDFNREIIYSLLFVSIVVLLTAITTVLFAKKNILNPIKKIMAASKRISEGNFHDQIDIQSNDEFESLADLFNSMAGRLQKQITDLVRMDNLKNEFIAIASHNLRTPLTTLRGYLDLLGSQKLTKKQKDTLIKAERSATTLSSLTEGLVNITSLETQGVKIEKDTVSLTKIINEALEEVSTQLKAKDINIVNNLGKEEILTIGDQAKLKQAFLAVLENSVKFNKKGGTVTLDKIIDNTRQPLIGRREVIVTVEDTGIGISKNEKENVFQKFNRGTSTYTYEYAGVGLGLYLAKLIIQAHHGRIWFESDEGAGTTFYISLSTAEDNGKKIK